MSDWLSCCECLYPSGRPLRRARAESPVSGMRHHQQYYRRGVDNAAFQRDDLAWRPPPPPLPGRRYPPPGYSSRPQLQQVRHSASDTATVLPVCRSPPPQPHAWDMDGERTCPGSPSRRLASHDDTMPSPLPPDLRRRASQLDNILELPEREDTGAEQDQVDRNGGGSNASHLSSTTSPPATDATQDVMLLTTRQPLQTDADSRPPAEADHEDCDEAARAAAHHHRRLFAFGRRSHHSDSEPTDDSSSPPRRWALRRRSEPTPTSSAGERHAVTESRSPGRERGWLRRLSLGVHGHGAGAATKDVAAGRRGSRLAKLRLGRRASQPPLSVAANEDEDAGSSGNGALEQAARRWQAMRDAVDNDAPLTEHWSFLESVEDKNFAKVDAKSYVEHVHHQSPPSSSSSEEEVPDALEARLMLKLAQSADIRPDRIEHLLSSRASLRRASESSVKEDTPVPETTMDATSAASATMAPATDEVGGTAVESDSHSPCDTDNVHSPQSPSTAPDFAAVVSRRTSHFSPLPGSGGEDGGRRTSRGSIFDRLFPVSGERQRRASMPAVAADRPTPVAATEVHVRAPTWFQRGTSADQSLSPAADNSSPEAASIGPLLEPALLEMHGRRATVAQLSFQHFMHEVDEKARELREEEFCGADPYEVVPQAQQAADDHHVIPIVDSQRCVQLMLADAERRLEHEYSRPPTPSMSHTSSARSGDEAASDGSDRIPAELSCSPAKDSYTRPSTSIQCEGYDPAQVTLVSYQPLPLLRDDTVHHQQVLTAALVEVHSQGAQTSAGPATPELQSRSAQTSAGPSTPTLLSTSAQTSHGVSTAGTGSLSAQPQLQRPGGSSWTLAAAGHPPARSCSLAGCLRPCGAARPLDQPTAAALSLRLSQQQSAADQRRDEQLRQRAARAAELAAPHHPAVEGAARRPEVEGAARRPAAEGAARRTAR